MKNLSAGRHIAPAIITRLPVIKDKTRLHGRRQRILEGHIKVDGKELVILAAHWTSRIRKGSEDHRADYGDRIYGTFKGMYRSNPRVALLVCGDFNDNPDDDSVTAHLHAVGDKDAVLASTKEKPLLLNLFADKDRKEYGTHYDRGKWSIFDQIAISPGLLEGGDWSCDPKSVKTVNTLVRPGDESKRPWRFGSRRDKRKRGYSDHFPVTVRLTVNAD
jgi:hypothetical protein